MSRVIKFRAWDGRRMGKCLSISLTEEGAFGANVDFGGGESEAVFGDSLSLMQFTGLTDCHGVEIYEDDILQPESYLKSKFGRGQIVAHEGMFRFAVGTELHQRIAPLRESLRRGESAGNPYIVISNIHENPELIP